MVNRDELRIDGFLHTRPPLPRAGGSGAPPSLHGRTRRPRDAVSLTRQVTARSRIAPSVKRARAACTCLWAGQKAAVYLEPANALHCIAAGR